MAGVSTAKKGTADLSTALRSGRDDKFVAWRDSAFPGEVRGTADPSASLGMTKESATLPWKSGCWTEGFLRLGSQGICYKKFVISTGVAIDLWPTQGNGKRLGPATTFYATVALSFVIPSEAEGSAVLRTFRGDVLPQSAALWRDLRFLCSVLEEGI
jgi:hypothetical protein